MHRETRQPRFMNQMRMEVGCFYYDTASKLIEVAKSLSRKVTTSSLDIYIDKFRYGDDKGACETIFSYGFLEDAMTSAKVMFLDLDIPDDDPLRPAKLFVSTAAPGFRIFDAENDIGWESDFIWLVVINEEDGLDFKVRQTIDGKRDIQAFWKDEELDPSKLHELMQESPAWDVFQLRAIVLLQQRVEVQIERLQGMQSTTREASIRDVPWILAERLRSLELEMLERTIPALEHQVRTMCLFSLLSCLASTNYPVRLRRSCNQQSFLFLFVTVSDATMN